MPTNITTAKQAKGLLVEHLRKSGWQGTIVIIRCSETNTTGDRLWWEITVEFSPTKSYRVFSDGEIRETRSR